jgi:hypothetical protein
VVNYNDPFTHSIKRDGDEYYLICIEDGELAVYNMLSGAACTVTGDISAYLSQGDGTRKSYTAAGPEDTTFIVNKAVIPAMAATKSPVRVNQACAHFKSGQYSVTYTLAVVIGGTEYSISYKTPDNSTSANADFIATNVLAQEFRDAFNATLVPMLNGAGHTGFTCELSGSTLRISAPAGVDFDIDTKDGQGDRQFICFKEKVKSFTDLPERCFDGYEVAVAGANDKQFDDYYLKYVGGQSTGTWQEVVSPDTQTTIDPATMPHLLVNTGKDTFEVKQGVWGARLAGDGDLTAQDPYFIGRRIVDIQFISGRLAIITEGTLNLSRVRNAYVFFPDTVQTNLDSAPLIYELSTGKVTIVTGSAVLAQHLHLWSDENQLVLSSGNDPLKEDTTEILPNTNYSYSGEVAPLPVGKSALMFGSSMGPWNRLMQVFYRGKDAVGEIDITGHVRRLVKGTLKHMDAGETAGVLSVLTEEEATTIYIYQWFNNGEERVLSAWNKWTLPTVEKILWAGVRQNRMYLLLKWVGKTTIESIPLDRFGDTPEGQLPLRLDHGCLGDLQLPVSELDPWTLTLPYDVPADQREGWVCVENIDDEVDQTQRGRIVPHEWVDGSTVSLSDVRSSNLIFGRIPVAYRKNSKLYVQDKQGTILPKYLQIIGLIVAHHDTSSYAVVWGANEENRLEFHGRVLGDPNIDNNEVVRATGLFRVDIGEEADDVEIKLLNDTCYPANWEMYEYLYALRR